MLKIFARLAIVLVFAFPMNLSAMSETTMEMCSLGYGFDSAACHLYLAGRYGISPEMACSMCVDIMACIRDRITNQGSTVSDALSNCRYDFQDNADANEVYNVIDYYGDNTS